jgi:hypothetical protein
MMKKLAAAVVILTAVVVWAVPACAFGVAISPGSIEATNVLHGSEVARSLTIFNDDAAKHTYTFVGKNMPLAGWVTVHDIKSGATIASVTVPPHSSRAVRVVIKVPTTAANGKYKAFLNAVPEAPTTGGVGAVLVPSLRLDISVTDKQIVQLLLESLIVSPIELGSPLQIDVSARNRSNVEVAPTLVFGVVGKDGKVLRQAEFDMSPIAVQRAGRERFSLGMEGLSKGEYGTYGQLKYGKTVTPRQWTSFAVVPPGAFARAELRDFVISGPKSVGRTRTLRATLSSLSPKALEPKLVADIYRDGLKIGSIESKKMAVDPYRQVTMVVSLPIEKSGAYRVEAYFVYSGKESNHAANSFRTSSPLATSGLVVVGLALVAGSGVYLWSRRGAGRGRHGGRGRHRQGGEGLHLAAPGRSDEDPQPRLRAG